METMKKSELTFAEGFTSSRGVGSNDYKCFDWDKAAEIIKKEAKKHPDLVAEAGLQGDWDYTGGVIFENGKPTNEEYTYLRSNWAIPTLILSYDGKEQQEIPCHTSVGRFDSDSQWDDKSLRILGIQLRG